MNDGNKEVPPNVLERDELQDMTPERRDKLLQSHPVLEREYTLPTPMMRRTYTIIRDRIWARRTGIVFHAPPRMGKTRCALAIRDLIAIEFPHIHITLLTARRSTRQTDGHMYRLILEGEDHALSSRANANLLFENAKMDIRLRVNLKGGSQYVLIIDEMQLLNDLDLQQLVCFHNALELVKIKMTTLSFAQPEILHRRSALMTSNDRQIIARFLSEPISFEGCSSKSELQMLLKAYDEDSEYPEDSGWSYTQFFFPLAFAHGFRLARNAAAIWSALTDAAGSSLMVPMEHVCLTIEHLLLVLRKQDCAIFSITTDDIERAVEAANLQAFSQLMNETGSA